MRIYKCGGTVRDYLLGKQPADYDYCVQGATIDEMLDKGYKQVGKAFPVFLDDNGNEYALCRIEKPLKENGGHKDFEFIFEPTITLKDDALRRDFTINAMYIDEDGQLIDYVGGIKDLIDGKIRHISEHFVEDPLRIIRAARLASTLGFTIDQSTVEICRQMVANNALDNLPTERIWKEFEKAFTNNFHKFILNLKEINALKVILPEIDKLFNTPENTKWHGEGDTGHHTILVLKQCEKWFNDGKLLFSLMLHDVGKGTIDTKILPHHYGHDLAGLPLINNICKRLKVPSYYQRLAYLICKYHMKVKYVLEMRPIKIYKMLDEITNNFQQLESLKYLLRAAYCDNNGRISTKPKNDNLEIVELLLINCYNALKDTKATDYPELLNKYSGKAFGEQYKNQQIKIITPIIDEIKGKNGL